MSVKDQVIYLTKLRDAYRMQADACSELINTLIPQAPKPQPRTTDVLSKFPENLRKQLYLDGDKIKAEPLKIDDWKQVNAIATEQGYHYVPASGQEKGHWELKK